MFSAYTERSAQSVDHQCESRLLVEALLERLDARELAVITLQFKDGRTLKEVGDLVGNVSRERARQISAKALRRMREPRRPKPEARDPYPLTDPLTDTEKADRAARKQERAELREKKRRAADLKQKRAQEESIKELRRYWQRMNVTGYAPDRVVIWLQSLSCLSGVKFTSPGGRFDQLDFQLEGVSKVFTDKARPALYRKVWNAIFPYLTDPERQAGRKLEGW